MKKTEAQLRLEMINYKVYQKNNRWYGYRICPKCNTEVLQTALSRGVILRNLRNLDKKRVACLSCSKRGKNNPFFKKTHSEKTKKQISKSRTGKACGESNAMAKPEHRESVSKTLLKKYASGELNFQKEKQRQTMTKSLIDGKLKTTPVSNAEKDLKAILESKGLEVVAQFSIGTLRYDLLLKKHKIIIEYNGDYWHCNPEKYKPDYFHKKKKIYAKDLWEQDRKKREVAEKSGYKLFIIWERDYMFNKENEINKIICNL